MGDSFVHLQARCETTNVACPAGGAEAAKRTLDARTVILGSHDEPVCT